MEVINLECLYRLRFSSAERVIEFCINLGLISRVYECPKCGKNMSLRPRPDVCDKFEWVCRSKSAPSHHIKRSVRSGSYFENSRMSIPDILLLTHFIVHRVEHRFCMFELSASSHTVCDWHSFVREVCMDACMRMNEQIGGEGLIVEIDESKFGKRKYNRGRHVQGKWVFGGVERGTNKCFFRVVERRDKETLLDIIKTFIRPGTTIYSDCWKSYDCLADEGFTHLTVNHSLHFKNPENDAHTNSIEGTWSAIKRSIPNRTVRDQFDSYLAEYMWRRAHSDTDDLTRAFLRAAAVVFPPRSSDPPPEEENEDEDEDQL